MQVRRKQRGIGLLSLMIYIGAGGFAVYTAFAVLPVYMEYLEVRSSVDSLSQGVSESDLNARRLKDLLLRRFQINSIQHAKADDIVVVPGQHGFEVAVDYEVRIPWVANIDLVMKFQHATQVKRS
ncbi:MAG TPA: DUF4845 domain-containing protein [Candidatus Macondimonas sp.]|nr:DUF4845 domain-containing protein [Candidatus Macondimonas sp.]